MNRPQVNQLLSLASMLQGRRGPDAEVSVTEENAWLGMLADVTIEDGLAAVREHYSTPGYPISVGDVLEHSRRVRAARHASMPIGRVPLPEGMDPDNVAWFIQWQRETTRAIGDGTYLAPPTPAAIRASPDVTDVLRSIPTQAQRAAAERAQRETARVAGEAERARQLAALHQIGDAS